MSKLTFLARPQFTAVISFSIGVEVDVSVTQDFTVLIADGNNMTTTIDYGSLEIPVGTVGTLEQQLVNPSEKLDGTIGTIPRVE